MSMPACSGRLRAWHAECVWCVWVCGCVGSGRQIGGRGIAVGVSVGGCGCGCGCGREAGGGEGRMHGRGARLLRAQQLSVVRHRRAELLRLLEGVALVSPRVCVPVGRLHLRARANARHGVAWRALPAMASRVTLGRPTQGRTQIQARSQASANSGQIGRQRRSRVRMGRAFRAWRRHRDLLEADALEARRRRVVRLARLGLRLSEARLLVRLLPPPCRRSQAQEVRVHRVSVSARGPIWGPHLHVGLRLLAAAAAAWRGDRRGVVTRRKRHARRGRECGCGRGRACGRGRGRAARGARCGPRRSTGRSWRTARGPCCAAAAAAAGARRLRCCSPPPRTSSTRNRSSPSAAPSRRCAACAARPPCLLRRLHHLRRLHRLRCLRRNLRLPLQARALARAPVRARRAKRAAATLSPHSSPGAAAAAAAAAEAPPRNVGNSPRRAGGDAPPARPPTAAARAARAHVPPPADTAPLPPPLPPPPRPPRAQAPAPTRARVRRRAVPSGS